MSQLLAQVPGQLCEEIPLFIKLLMIFCFIGSGIALMAFVSEKMAQEEKHVLGLVQAIIAGAVLGLSGWVLSAQC